MYHLIQSTIPQLYEETLGRLEDAVSDSYINEQEQYYYFEPSDRGIVQYYNRALFMPKIESLEEEEPLLSTRDWGQVEQKWLGEDPSYAHPGIVVVDNLLTQRTLKRVRDYLLLSTFWYEAKLPKYGHYGKLTFLLILFTFAIMLIVWGLPHVFLPFSPHS